jgi:filamentous hemagglutinin family protein
MNTPVFLLPLLALTGLSIGVGAAQAQVYQPSNRIPVADNTLGTQVVGSNNNFAITGGVNRGQNTFHSFQDFSVPTNGVATFANPIGNQNVITRVTGSLFSDINGTINTQGANFLLINPNGVVFGPGTQLNVGKAFTASTASGIDLVDGAGKTLNFGVNGAGDGALLSIDPKVIFNVSRFNMGGGNGEIKNFGTLQTNNPNQYIGLLGGNVALDGGKINAPGGRVELGGLSTIGSVDVGTEGGSTRWSFPENVDSLQDSSASRANVSFSNQSRINVAGAGSGDATINSHDFKLSDGSVIRGGTEKNAGIVQVAAGNINILATGKVSLDSGSSIANAIRANSTGVGGDIGIQAKSVFIDNRSSIANVTAGTGNSGNIAVKTNDNISIFGGSNITNGVDSSVVGNSGNIDIVANSIYLKDNSLITIGNSGIGNTGYLNIKAKGDLSLDKSSLFNSTTDTGVGINGSIEAVAKSISLNDGSLIASVNSGKGKTGDVILNAKENILLSGSLIASAITGVGVGSDNIDGGNIIISTNSMKLNNISSLSTSNERQGSSGNININVLSLEVMNGSQINASNDIKGNAGNIILNVADFIKITGTGSLISAVVRNNGIGNSGDITLKTGYLTIQDGGSITTAMGGKGNGGSINIRARDGIKLLERAGVISSVIPKSEGNGGKINIETEASLIINDASILSANLGIGDGGDIVIKAAGLVEIKNNQGIINGTGISSTVNKKDSSGSSGNVVIEANSISSQGISGITTFNRGQGKAGSVNLSAKDSVTLSGKGFLIVDSLGDNGGSGDIIINAPDVILKDGFQTSASSASGNGGNVFLGGSSPILSSNPVKLLLLTGGSNISTDSQGKTGGNGGNININAVLIAAISKENSDISANALGGNGGNIKINTQNITGIEFRPLPTKNSDITVASRFGQSGTANINTPGIDPSKNATELPNNLTDAGKQITQTCSSSQRENKVIITGRGGHPETADALLSNSVTWLDPRHAQTSTVSSPVVTSNSVHPAVGWAFNGKGKVTLLAPKYGQSILMSKVACPTTQKTSSSGFY